MNKKEIKGIMTPQDLVVFYFQELRVDSEEVDEILWNFTSYPFQDLEIINNEIYAFYLNSRV